MNSTATAVMVPAVVQAIRILRHLARSGLPLGVTPIARELGISPSSCFNLLKTLTAEGLVEFDTEDKRYRLGAGLNDIARPADRLVERIRPKLEALAAGHAMASGLWSVTDGRLVLVAFADSELATRIHMTVGQRLPMFIGAMGRCLAAQQNLSAAQAAEAIEPLRWARRPTPERYRREVLQAQRRGWAMDDGDFMAGVTTIAAPIVDGSNTVRYCIANTLFQGQASEQEIQAIGEETARCAIELSEREGAAVVRTPPPPRRAASPTPPRNPRASDRPRAR